LSPTPPQADAVAYHKRLGDALVVNIYTVQHQVGCTNDLRIDPRLQLAAQWHTNTSWATAH
jgi:hypothetical protein